MYYDKQITLGTATEYTLDAHANQTATISGKTVWCGEKSITQTEYYSAGQQGLKPQTVVEMWEAEYSGQESVVFGGNKYRVYRTYTTKDGHIELYLTSKGADKNG